MYSNMNFTYATPPYGNFFKTFSTIEKNLNFDNVWFPNFDSKLQITPRPPTSNMEVQLGNLVNVFL
jgi:hypothetical protein